MDKAHAERGAVSLSLDKRLVQEYLSKLLLLFEGHVKRYDDFFSCGGRERSNNRQCFSVGISEIAAFKAAIKRRGLF